MQFICKKLEESKKMAAPKKRKSEVLQEVRKILSPLEKEKIDTKLALSARIADAVQQRYAKKGDFAEAVGVQNGLVSRWLSGSHNFTVDTLVEIEHILDIQLLNREPFLSDRQF